MPLRIPTQRPALILTLVAIVVIATCLRLSWWQLERAQWKRRIHHALVERSRANPIALDASFRYRDDLRFRTVRARGSFIAAAEIHLDNQVRDGRPGALVATPFQVEHGGPRVLVLRGWVPWSADRGSLPEVPAPTGTIEISGMLDAPPAHGIVLGEAPAAAFIGKVWPWLNEAALQQRAGPLASGFVLRQNGPDELPLQRVPAVFEEKRAMHLGYAIHWAALALLAFFLYWRLLRAPQTGHSVPADKAA